MGGEKWRGAVSRSSRGCLSHVDKFDGAGRRRPARNFPRWKSQGAGPSVCDCFGSRELSARRLGCGGAAGALKGAATKATLASGEFFDLFGEFFDLFGLSDDRQREHVGGIGFLHFVFQFAGEGVEL